MKMVIMSANAEPVFLLAAYLARLTQKTKIGQLTHRHPWRNRETIQGGIGRSSGHSSSSAPRFPWQRKTPMPLRISSSYRASTTSVSKCRRYCLVQSGTVGGTRERKRCRICKPTKTTCSMTSTCEGGGGMR